MNASESNIDIKENELRQTGSLLDILLVDRTTKKNIIWATDSYDNDNNPKNKFFSKNQIKSELVTGKYNFLIQPRAAKSLEEQRRRTKDKAEVFTPLNIIDQINTEVDDFSQYQKINKKNWQSYVKELKLEITCGEAPFIVSRYDPTAYFGELIKLEDRVGFLDRKLKVVSRYCDKKSDWLFWAKEAFKTSYGYEWQGDNILIARENLLYTFKDFYKDKFKKNPDPKLQEKFAEIISWNIFQMDGIKYVVPMSCHHEIKIIPSVQTLFEEIPEKIEKYECEGCKYNRPMKHNGVYVKVMDWEKNKIVKFVDLIF